MSYFVHEIKGSIFVYLLMLIGLSSFFQVALAEDKKYELVIERGDVQITEKVLNRITVNGGIPGPTLEFTEGDNAIIKVVNRLDEDTSVHWHGLLLPGLMDGVPGLNGYEGIKPGESFEYQFTLRQSGTYWYHAHSGAQEQDGHYGSLIVHPKDNSKQIPIDLDYVVLLSDFHEHEGNLIIRNLKKSSEYYVYVRRTLKDFWNDVGKVGFGKAWANAKAWGQMRMLPTDLADVTNYTFLVNGKAPKQNWTGLFKAGQKIKLRFINASAMSFFDVRVPGLEMLVVAADGQDIEPVTVDEFRFGVAETYDVVVTPKENKAYTIVAESIDRTGFAVGTLAPKLGMVGDAPRSRPMSLLTMADMGMSDHQTGHDHNIHHHNHHQMHSEKKAQDFNTGVPGSGWAQMSTLKGKKALTYKDLRYLGEQEDLRDAEREIIVTLGGNMERYIWTLNGKKYQDAKPIELAYGERVRMTFVNETMMAHPMHLHGMFMQLENGQPMNKLPNKHTVIVAPGDRYSVLITANEVGEWAFHCHLLYHMMAGMMNEVVVAKLNEAQMPDKLYSVKSSHLQEAFNDL